MTTEPIELLTEEHETKWTVHVIGPDDIYQYDSYEEMAAEVSGMIQSLGLLYPRGTEFQPLMRIVISPPSGVRS